MSKSTDNEVYGMSENTSALRIREEFESALRDEKERQGFPWVESWVARRIDGEYENVATRAMWWAWKASRDCIRISIKSIKPELSDQVCADVLAAGMRLGE